MTAPGCSRRRVLAGLALSLAVPGRSIAASDAFPGRVKLMVAGPAGGALDQVARTLSTGLAAHLPSGSGFGYDTVGGLDGVTGANQFAAVSTLDGSVALLVPGAASLAWLAGDSRVHFDPSRWLPIMARTSPAFVVGQAGATVRPGARLRVASGGAVSPALAAMLAVDLIGAQVQPVYGLAEDSAALAALQNGEVDAVLLRGPSRLARLRLHHPELRPQFTFGTPTGAGDYQRDPLIPAVPTLVEYNARFGRVTPKGPRFDAWACAASAAQLQYALVLPGLTPPSAVALWRNAGAQALAPDLASATDMVYASAASVLLRTLCPGGAALLELRTWLADRLGWQPG